MIHVFSCPPALNVSGHAATLAKSNGLPLISDPTKARVNSLGFQTLYDMPKVLQRTTRRRLISEHVSDVMGRSGGVYDHSVFQMLADWMRWFWSETPTEEWEGILREVGPCVKRYSVVHSPSGLDLRPYDGFVWRDARNISQIAPLLSALHSQFGVQVALA